MDPVSHFRFILQLSGADLKAFDLKNIKKTIVFIVFPGARDPLGAPWNLWGGPGDVLEGHETAHGVPRAPVDARWGFPGRSWEVLVGPGGSSGGSWGPPRGYGTHWVFTMQGSWAPLTDTVNSI